MTYELLLASRAESDVDRIARFLAERSPQGANAGKKFWTNFATIHSNTVSHPNRKNTAPRFARCFSRHAVEGFIAFCLRSLAEVCTSSMFAGNDKTFSVNGRLSPRQCASNPATAPAPVIPAQEQSELTEFL